MIEVIDQEEKEGTIQLPKNIRQIGEIKGNQRIYIEDYVHTFLKKMSRNTEEEATVAILFGEYRWSEDTTFLFVKSALHVEHVEITQENLILTDKVWSQVYEESRKYFPEQEIVGWFVSISGFRVQINESLLKTHVNHFGGADKILFAMEPAEWEEAVYRYENHQMLRQSGYYIYYEQNEQMQTYMIEKNQNKSIEETEKVPDRAVMDFRKMIQNKKEPEKMIQTPPKEEKVEKEQGVNVHGWLLGACAAAVVLAAGFTFFHRYQDMQTIFGKFSSEEEDLKQYEVKSASIGRADMASEEEQEEESNTEVEERSEEMPIEEDDVKKEDTSEQEELQESEKTEETPSEEAQEENSQEEVAVEESKPQENKPEKREQEYVIKRGDTLTSICTEKYGSVVRMQEICQRNGIQTTDIIYPGQKIFLPE